MKYPLKSFLKEFPDEEACLRYLFSCRFPELKGFSFFSPRKCFVNSKGRQIYPTAGTIFHGSSTPLTVWFHAIYLFWVSKNGVSAKELERQLGVTYKTAWRIGKSIRKLMVQDTDPLSGTVEVDETYVGGWRRMSSKMANKNPVFGMAQRGGRVRAFVVPNRTIGILLKEIRANIKKGTQLMTDDFVVYRKMPQFGYPREFTNHSEYEFVRGNVHTNRIEAVWSQLKRSLRGTYVSVSPKYLQSYLNEVTFRLNHRNEPFHSLLERL